jgi:hypothetical protein
MAGHDVAAAQPGRQRLGAGCLDCVETGLGNRCQVMRQHNTRMKTRPQQVNRWTRIVIKAGEALLSFKVDSWQNGVNRNVDGRTVRRVLGYNGNGAHFRRTTDEVATGGYQEFAFR